MSSLVMIHGFQVCPGNLASIDEPDDDPERNEQIISKGILIFFHDIMNVFMIECIPEGQRNTTKWSLSY